MSEASDAVITANARFYRALGNADLEAMSLLWLHSDESACVHPGWPMLEGWELIRQSWEAIFENQGPFRVWPGEVSVHLDGTTAWVTCIENIDTSRELTDVLVQTQATNIFRMTGGEWKMIHHHASPLPTGSGSGEERRISPN
ncbi:MAG: nuclear transport factor 2 family protein [Chloroflexi bacterium]|nr:nuclear transport factor 2 family protein [Chloroflexota bacterium]